MPSLRARPIAAAVAALFAASPALSQVQTLPEVTVQGEAERADGPVQGYRATRSSTFTRTDTPLREVPASVSVVPSQVMRDQAMQGLSDVLRYVPGVVAHQGEGNRDDMVIRGIRTNADFYVDGVRDDAQVFRDLYNLERVEALKGPSGMAFGRGGAGGVVNRVTRKPVFDRLREGSVTLGSFDQRRGTLDIGDRLGESAAWRLNAMAEDAGSFRDGVDLSRLAVNPTLTLVPGAKTEITLGYEHLQDRRTADRGIPSRNGQPFDTDRGRFFGNADQSRARSTVDALHATVDHEFEGGLRVRNTSRLTRYDKFYENVYPGSAVNAAGNLTLSAYNNSNDRTNFFNQTDFTRKLALGGLEHTLLAGVEIGRQSSASVRNTGFFGAATSVTVAAGNPYAVATSFRPNGADANNKVRADTAAAYVQDQVAINREWKALAGLRYDRFSVDFDDRRTTVAQTDLSRTDGAFSPRAGLTWTPHPATTFYASYGYAFLPSGEQLGLATTTVDLSPEKARNYELGAKFDLLSRLALSAALFRTDRDNVRVADPANPGFFVKTGQQRTEGLELGLQGHVTSAWQVYGGYTHMDGRVTQPLSTGTAASVATIIPAGAKLGLVPEHLFSLWNRFEVGEGWATGLGVIHQSSSFATISNTVKLPAFTRFDGAVFYTFADKKTKLALNVENLFDKKYYPTVDGDNNISPGAPRTARVKLSMGF